MTRVTTTVLIIVILMNSVAGIMQASGLSNDMGVQLQPGGQDASENATQTARDKFQASEGLGDTLFALFTAAMTFLGTLMSSVFAAPRMLMNLGVPGWFIVPVFAPMYIVGALEILYAATGRDLV